MTKFDRMEESIQELEKLLGISVTVIDRDGCFHSPSGYPVFAIKRQSHQKNPVCRAGFCERCVRHCRYEMNEKGEKVGEYFFHKCWKGAMELVVPIIFQGYHMGSFFAGIWRDGDDFQADGLSREITVEYKKLPVFDRERAESLGKALSVFVDGLLAALVDTSVIDFLTKSRMSRIKNYITKNASGRASLDGLANELAVSISRAGHLVRELSGKSFTELLKVERINRAKNLLMTTELTAGEIALIVGIADEYHFNKLFKSTVGLPPGKYRKNVAANF